jgi:hypothetical protein
MKLTVDRILSGLADRVAQHGLSRRVLRERTLPRVTVGLSFVRPYDADFAWEPGAHPHDLGASPTAMAKLAGRLGYRLVGANVYGFNAFYLRDNVAPGLVPAVELAATLHHPRNTERMQLFEGMKHIDFEVV